MAPAGRSSASIFCWRAALTAPVSSPAGLAVTVAARAPSIRVMETGPGTSSTVATSPSRTGPRGSALSPARVVTGFAEVMRTSRSVSSRVALAAGVPRTAWATTVPSEAGSRPASAAAGFAVTETRGTDCERSLRTSVTPSIPATAVRTCSAACASTRGSAALTTTLRSWPPKPSPAARVVSPIPSRPASPFSMACRVFSYEADSSRLTWYEAWFAPVPPPKAAMKPDEPTVTW